MKELTDPSLMDVPGVEKQVGARSSTGLTSAEAASRLKTDGPNRLVVAKKRSFLESILDQFASPLVWLLLLAVVISVIAWIVDGAVGVPVDGIVVAAIVIANAVLGLVQQKRAGDAIAALNSTAAATSSVLRDGELLRIPAADLVRGDTLVLNEGDTVGADARIVQAASLTAAEASLTGESEAVSKQVADLPGPAPLGDRLNMVYKGTSITQGTGRAVVTGVGMSTELGSIAHLLHQTIERPTPLEREIAHIGKVLSIAVVAIALAVMTTIVIVDGVRTPADIMVVLLLGVSLAVAAVPEGLPAILSVVLALGAKRLAARKALVKQLNSVEALGAASVICSDKTGTLTRNEMTIQCLVTATGRSEVSGVGYTPDGRVTGPQSGSEARSAEARILLLGGSLANNAQFLRHGDIWEIEGDPTEAAFLVAAQKVDGLPEELKGFSRLSELPFTSERKLMSTVDLDRGSQTRTLFTKGAPDVLLGRCSHLQVGDSTVPLTEELRGRAINTVNGLNDQAFRTLSVAYRRLRGEGTATAKESLEDDLVYVGVAGIIDPPRTEAVAAIAEAHRAGIRVIMITGDHPRTAVRVATELGIADEGETAITGTQMDDLNDNDLSAATRATSVFARVSPHHKLRLVSALQRDGHVVSMTGDGVNDAPALKAADVGIAMGITGTEVSKEAARLILADDNFASIVHAVHEGRNIFDNIRKFLRYLLSSNAGEVLTVFLGVTFAGVLGLADASPETVVLPLLATQILWMNLLTDTGPALAMGVDPEIDDAMSRTPRSSTAHAIDGRMWSGVLVVGLVMALASLFALDVLLPGGLMEGSSSLDVARTAAFTTLVFAQLFNALSSRSESTTAFSGLFSNRWLWGAIGLGVVLQGAVVHLPALQTAFGTASLTPLQWAMCVALSSTVLWCEELRKVILRRSDRRRSTIR